MRVRKPFIGAFAILVLASTYVGLAPNHIPQYKQSDKVLHFITFFLLTLSFYWIFETSRRRCLNLTVVCAVGLGVGSEVLQDLLPNDRNFDYLDIAANFAGSTFALGLCAWYHKRMLERKRAAKTYHTVSSDEEANAGELGDVELEEGLGGQENGVIKSKGTSLEEEVENWDENGNDEWDETNTAQYDGAKVVTKEEQKIVEPVKGND